MKIKKILFALLLVSILPCSVSAQLLKVGLGGGVTQILGPESLTNDISLDGAGFSTEWNIGLVGKLDLPLIPITPRGFVFYHSLSGSGGDVNIETSQSIFEIGLGAQYNFIPIPFGVDPYISLDLSSTSFGDYTVKYNSNEIKTPGESRIGLALGLGTEVTIVPVINLDLYLSYKMFNLIGKENGEETVSAVTLEALVMFSLL
jgi:hypothetical protein